MAYPERPFYFLRNIFLPNIVQHDHVFHGYWWWPLACCSPVEASIGLSVSIKKKLNQIPCDAYHNPTNPLPWAPDWAADSIWRLVAICRDSSTTEFAHGYFFYFCFVVFKHIQCSNKTCLRLTMFEWIDGLRKHRWCRQQSVNIRFWWGIHVCLISAQQVFL